MIKRFILLVMFIFVLPNLSIGGSVNYGHRVKLTNEYGYTNKWMSPHTLYPGKHSGVYSEELKRNNRRKFVREQYEKSRNQTPAPQVPSSSGGTYYRSPTRRNHSTSSIMISRGNAIITWEIRERVYELTGKYIPYKISLCRFSDILKTHFKEGRYKSLTEYVSEQCFR